MCVAYLTEFACGCVITVPWYCPRAEKRGAMCAGNLYNDQDGPRKTEQVCAGCVDKGGKKAGKQKQNGKKRK